MYGYCTTPRILPGQTAQIAIVENPSRKEGGAYDGEMINEKLSSNMSYIDNIIYAALHPFDPQATYKINDYQTMTADEINQHQSAQYADQRLALQLVQQLSGL